MKFSTIALACTMAPFATAAWPHDALPRGQENGWEDIYAYKSSIAKNLTADITRLESRISKIKVTLDILAPYICEGKVSPFTVDCKTAAVYTDYSLRNLMEAFEIQVESEHRLWKALDEPIPKAKSVKEWADRLQCLTAQLEEVEKVAVDLEALRRAAKVPVWDACKSSFDEAKVMCSKARPLTKDEL
ncbi:hypothetical protein LTR56_023153 [Elasticomyces elasticus]|nr:hypothetical protein LTR56_023153 [Elasticomyces elasticus]KAK3647418.1 hypothetical protein LTR22_013711 [Elasticomyces elasticus]KAK4906959.1 hypothetical protein LTR49_023992 [Elasticomyces elasticus]KAK5750168.1 hypothetical protein LTS12_019732 [Elasticomyces elasticus]